VGYDRESLEMGYRGAVVTDHYGRKVPRHAHGTQRLKRQSASVKLIVAAAMELFDRVVDPELLCRRINLTAANVIPESQIARETAVQLDLFAQPDDGIDEALEREKRRQQAVLEIRKKFGKNAILKGMNYQEGATARERNEQIGGHKA
jgi:DNA polymerase V